MTIRRNEGRACAGLLLAASLGCSSRDTPPPPKADAAPPTSSVADPDAKASAAIDPDAAAPADDPAAACTSPCTPRVIAEGAHPGCISVDATHVRWIQGDALWAASRAGGAPAVIARDVLCEDIAADDDAVYVCRRRADLDRDVLRVSKADDSVTTLGTVGNCALAVSDKHLYVSARTASWKKTLARLPKTGGTPEPLGPESLQLSRIVADGAHVFWASDNRIQRVDEATQKVDVVVTDEDGIEDLAVTRTHVYWMRGSDLWRAPREGGGAPERIANHQNALSMASDGTHVYWASIGDRRWSRYDPRTRELQVRAMDEGPGWIAVDGTEVFVTVFGGHGRVEALQTCACSPAVLEARPPIRIAEGPDTEQAIRAGSADAAGRMQVQIRDLSSDEAHDVDALVASGVAISLDDERVPQRFRKGAEFRVATTEGVFDARLVGADAGMGGEGNHFYIDLQGPPAIAGRFGLVTRVDGPKIGALRSATAEPDAARKVLAAVRKASDAAGHGRRIGRNHVTAVRGNFPAPHVYAVTVTFPIPGAGEDELSEVSAFWFTDADGNVTHELLPLEDRLDTYGIDYLVDVGEDGTDEIVWNSRYYEGDYELIVTWDGSTPSYETLSGDGA